MLIDELQGEMDAQVRGRGHDFYRIRPYEAMESARHVDWKASAHTGELQVREFSREQEPLVEVFLDLNVPLEACEWFERAVDAAASICWHVASRGARLRFRNQVFDREVPVEADIYTILKFLALVEPVRTAALPGPGREDSLHVVLTNSPARLVAAGWNSAYLIGPDSLRSADPRSAAGGEKT